MMSKIKIVIMKVALLVFVLITQALFSLNIAYAAKTQLTDKQARALRSLNNEQQSIATKALRLKITLLKDNQGQQYLGALVNRAELLPYLTQLERLLADDFSHYRALQAARDHQLFHLTILSPLEFQLADKAIVNTLLASDFSHAFSSQINVTLLGLAKVEQDNKSSFFVVAQSADAQKVRQRFLLPAKDFHVTLGFNPSDIYGVKKDSSTLID